MTASVNACARDAAIAACCRSAVARRYPSQKERHIGAGDSDTFNLKRGDAPFVELACGAEVARPRSGTKANKQRETVRPVRSTFCALQSPVKMDSDG